jgi:hypothetical protein
MKEGMHSFHLATFAADITPPLGHPLGLGTTEPVRDVEDPLRALGVVLLGMGKPIVLCALDWGKVANEAHAVWRQAMASAAHTVPDHVALQVVHQHDAPFADLEAERFLETVPDAPRMLDLSFFERAVNASAQSLRASLARTMPFTHIGLGQAKVEQVASNRRVIGADGKIQFWRGSATGSAEARAKPEGLVDPWLKTVSFWNHDQPLAALSYYATHPMSHYGKGHVSSDFCGLARQKRQDEDRQVFQVYFTGCSGNIAAGKYNDGKPENRPVLRDRIYSAMRAAWSATRRYPIDGWRWRTAAVLLPPRAEKSFGAALSRKEMEDPKALKLRRGNDAFQLSWLERSERPFTVSCLDFGRAAVLHLPGEPFIQYQLYAQGLRKDAFVCVAGYGDGGPGYIPDPPAFFEGGYETTVALSGPGAEPLLHRAMSKLLQR